MAQIRKIVWSERAANDLEQICNYIANHSIFYAKTTAKKIMYLIETAAEVPGSGRIVPEYCREDLRERVHKSYRIVYRVKEDAIEIVTIFHAARLIKDVLPISKLV